MNNDPWLLLFAHKYQQALKIYDAELRKTKHPDAGFLSSRATALLCLGKLQEALADFTRANELDTKEVKGSSAYLENIAIAQWLLGKKSEAIQTLRHSVEGILSGKITYADSAGGATQGLLLFYAALSIKDDLNYRYAVDYLQKLAKKSKIREWPGPLALLILNHPDAQDAIRREMDGKTLSQAMKSSKSDLFIRRQLCQWLFYEAVHEREQGNEGACMKRMRECRNLENPILEQEWYLAKNECEASASLR